MSAFAELIPDNAITASLGDDMVYNAPGGDIAIKGLFWQGVTPDFSGNAHISEITQQLDVALADVPGLTKGSSFTIGGLAYIVADIIDNNGRFAKCQLKK